MRNSLLYQVLRSAADRRWTGTLFVHSRLRAVGGVVVVRGRIAWAVGRDNNNALGEYLVRKGLLLRPQLELARARLSQPSENRSLTEILMETGAVQTVELRRALLIHTRASLSTMLDSPAPYVKELAGESVGDQALLFTLAEVAPFAEEGLEEEHNDGEQPEPNIVDRTPAQESLAQLISSPGYMASGVFDADGELVAAHVSGWVDPVEIGGLVTSVRPILLRMRVSQLLGGIDGVHLRSPEGTVVIQPVTSSNDMAVVVVERANQAEAASGMLRAAVHAMAPSDGDVAPDQGFRDLLRSMTKEGVGVEEAVHTLSVAVRMRLDRGRHGTVDNAILMRALRLLEHRDVTEAVAVLESIGYH